MTLTLAPSGEVVSPISPAAGTPPAAPAAVVPAAAPAGPQKSTVEIATDAARARLAETGTSRPRDPDTGQFKKPDAPVAGQAAETPEEPNGEGEESPDEIEAREAREAAEAAAAPKPEKKGEKGEKKDEAKPLVVELFDRNGKPVEFEVADQVAADTLRSYKNAFVRSTELREAQAALAQREEQLDQRDVAFEIDPIGALTSGVLKGNPAMTKTLVLSLLAEHWDLLKDDVLAMDDPAELRMVKAEAENARNKLAQEAGRAVAEQAAVRENLPQVIHAVESIAALGDLTPRESKLLVEKCFREIQAYATERSLLTLQPSRIPAILAETLTEFGIDPVAAAAALAANGNGKKGKAAAAVPAARAAAPAAPKKPDVPTGQRFVASARMKAQAASPSAGAGSPGTGAAGPPRNADGSKMTVEQTVAWHRANRGLLIRK